MELAVCQGCRTKGNIRGFNSYITQQHVSERTLFALSTFGMSTKAYPLLFVESLSVGKRTEVTVPGPRIS